MGGTWCSFQSNRAVLVARDMASALRRRAARCSIDFWGMLGLLGPLGPLCVCAAAAPQELSGKMEAVYFLKTNPVSAVLIPSSASGQDAGRTFRDACAPFAQTAPSQWCAHSSDRRRRATVGWQRVGSFYRTALANWNGLMPL